jgi:hypothetical protein
MRREEGEIIIAASTSPKRRRRGAGEEVLVFIFFGRLRKEDARVKVRKQVKHGEVQPAMARLRTNFTLRNCTTWNGEAGLVTCHLHLGNLCFLFRFFLFNICGMESRTFHSKDEI